MSEQKSNVLKNPVTSFYRQPYPSQQQAYPGLQSEMAPQPDCGETSYQGLGRLRGRKALVTGGDSGIGRAVAIAFAREGADVALSFMPQEQSDAWEVEKLIKAEGRICATFPGDLSQEIYCRELVEEADDALGGLDILALAAGHQVATRSIEDISTEQLLSVFSINVFSMFWIVQAALPILPEGSSIITTTSRQAFDPEPALADYAASKGAIKVFTQSMGKQLAAKGIRINTVAPGPVWTPLQISGGRFSEEIEDFGTETPYQRAGQPVELAPAYVYLASNESSYVSGQVLGVTGGVPL